MRDSCHIVKIFLLFSQRKNGCSRKRQNNHDSDANGSSPFLDALYAARRYKASEEHLTECLIALRNSESDSHEKRETAVRAKRS